jgi:hypothetical protein
VLHWYRTGRLLPPCATICCGTVFSNVCLVTLDGLTPPPPTPARPSPLACEQWRRDSDTCTMHLDCSPCRAHQHPSRGCHGRGWAVVALCALVAPAAFALVYPPRFEPIVLSPAGNCLLGVADINSDHVLDLLSINEFELTLRLQWCVTSMLPSSWRPTCVGLLPFPVWLCGSLSCHARA